MPLKVALCEPNIRMGGNYFYLPIVSGILRAYAETDAKIKSNYEFAPFIYSMDAVDKIVGKYDKPDIAAFSVSMWNEQVNLAVASEIKRKFPLCLIIFGGYSVPPNAVPYMEQHKFVDICVRAEGEEAFKDILLRKLEEDYDYSGISDVTYRIGNNIVENKDHRNFTKDLDAYPSPYLEGKFDYLVQQQSDKVRFQSIVETNRGCLSAGTLIDTVDGYKAIEDVSEGDLVLGWDETEHKVIWNKVEKSICTGIKDTYDVRAGEFSIEATGDHPIYTKDGWKSVSEVKEGEFILCNLRKVETDRVRKDLLEGMWPDFEDGKHKENKEISVQKTDTEKLFSLWRTWQTTMGSEKGLGNSQVLFKSMCEESKSKESQETMACYNGAEAKEELSHMWQVYGTSTYVKEGVFQRVCVPENTFYQDRGQESDEEQGSQKESDKDLHRERSILGGWRKTEEFMEGPRKERDINRTQQAHAEERTKQIREKGNVLFREKGASFQIYWGFQFLDRSLCFWQVQEPRFYMYNQGKEISYISSRTVLAPGYKEGKRGAERLPQQGMGVYDYLGRRKVMGRYAQGGTEVCWSRIKSVTYTGKKKVYDLVNAKPYPNFFANGVLAHNCPFDCSFCAWGRGGLATKFRFHSMNRVRAEIDWMGKNRISYVFNADSNFAQHPRDQDIAQYLVETKRKYGYPEKFRTCFGKNADEKIFKAAAILHEADMEKGVTLARQSNDKTTLENIRRQNISLQTYRNLQERFNEKGIPVYIELILGLPGETVESWKSGIDDALIRANSKTSLFSYLCQVFPNTEMWEQSYRDKFGIKTKRIKLTEIHGAKREVGWVDEFEEITIATNSMSHQEWREMCKFSWMTMLLHSMKAGFFVMGWLWDRFKIKPSEFVELMLTKTKPDSSLGKIIAKWDTLLDNMMLGEGRGEILEDYGEIYWDVEEAAVLKLSEDWGLFYRDLTARLIEFLRSRDLDFGLVELYGVTIYQQQRMPGMTLSTFANCMYDYNVPEYFDKLFSSSPIPLEKKGLRSVKPKPKDFGGDKKRFAKETVLWGRKSGTMLVEVERSNICEIKQKES